MEIQAGEDSINSSPCSACQGGRLELKKRQNQHPNLLFSLNKVHWMIGKYFNSTLLIN